MKLIFRQWFSKATSLLLKSNFLGLFVLSAVIVLVFGRLMQTFYQQDEWNGMGLVFSKGIDSVFPDTFMPIDLLLAKGRILSSLIFYFVAVNFPLQNLPLVILAIILHLAGTFLVFVLAKNLVNNTPMALLGAVFFAVNSVSHEAITWPVISISTVGSSILVLLSVSFFFSYLESSRQKFLLSTGLLLYLSLWFKETGLYLFLLFPLAALFFKRYRIKLYLAHFWWFLLPFFVIVGYRVLELRFGVPDPNLYISATNNNFFLTITIRLLLYPLTSFSLMFIPGKPFIEVAREVLRDNYKFFANSPNNVLIAQSVILDLLAVILTGFMLFFIIIFLRKETVQNIRTVLFWLIFTFLSFSPYVVLSKDFSYLESRYYYLSVAGGAVLFSWLLARIWAFFGKRLFIIIVLPVALAFIYWHAYWVTQAINEQVLYSSWRMGFISQLNNLVPTLEKDKNVFYITSDKNYWADGNKIPFQQGTGYTLMVLYNGSTKIPKEFLKDRYLFDIGSQGYRESRGLGFGYFWSKEELAKAVREYNVPAENIVRLRYNSDLRQLLPE